MKILIALTLFLSGCTLIPNSVRPELVHQSHLTQHEPFTNHPTDYGTDDLDVVAHWGKQSGTFFEIGEGISLNRHWQYGADGGYGEVLGPREFFVARFGYAFRVRP